MAYAHPLLPSIKVLKRGESALLTPFNNLGSGAYDAWNLQPNFGIGTTATNAAPNGWSFSVSGDNVTIHVPSNAPFLANRAGANGGKLYYGLHEPHEAGDLDDQFQLSLTSGGFNLRQYEFSVRNVRPVASFTATGEGDTAAVDASDSSDADSAGIQTYQWDWDGDGTFDEDTLSPIASHAYGEDGEYEIRLRVIDMDSGLSHIVTQTVSVTKGRIASCLDPNTGALFSAVNDGDNVQIYRFPDGIASREELASVANSRAASLFAKPSGVLVTGVTDRTTGDLVRKTSRNYGETFS